MTYKHLTTRELTLIADFWYRICQIFIDRLKYTSF